MKRLASGLAVLGLLFGWLVQVRADFTTINFDALQHDDALLDRIGPVYQSQGFILTATDINPLITLPDFRSVGTESVLYAGATTLFQHNSGGEIELTQTDGGAFNFYSIDLAELPSGDASGNPVNSGPFDITFYGVKTGGTVVSETTTVTGFLTLTTSSFSGFDDVTEVYWFQGGGGASSPTHQFDNIVVESVPEPSAIVLFGIGGVGLAGWGWRRRSTWNAARRRPCRR